MAAERNIRTVMGGRRDIENAAVKNINLLQYFYPILSMTTAFIKNSLIERVKKMKGSEARKFYGLILEDDLDDSLYKTFEDIPEAHKLAINKEMEGLKKGKNIDFSNIFVTNFSFL